MKFILIALTLGAVTAGTNAWTFNACGQIFDGDGNRACTRKSCNAGQNIDYDVGFFQSCTLRTYADAACSIENGISSRDWDHTLGQHIAAFDIRDC
ncbi:hypothetical protein DFH08DRAFT_92224 [Mycena albidolilacea]|uniref:Uncharacterized protein n=1 Tax=Mycena albidolilacea TaxID=1033008 RepID=A0AAD7A9G0_9AGAR|nr:hypothetical protein DFH08DRAFT_92224 [Mycena albidolilacea]